MKNAFIITLLFLHDAAHAGEGAFFAQGGFGVHQRDTALPEVNWQSPLATLSIGYESESDWIVHIRHESSVPQQEKGSGLNVIWIEKRIYFQ
jgi:hypothetical protein